MSVTVEVDEEEPTPGLLPDGKPDPSYAASLGLIPAPFGRRALGLVIDLIIIVVLTIPAFIALAAAISQGIGPSRTSEILTRPGALITVLLFVTSAILVTIAVIGQLAFHGRKGLTVGKSFVGIRSVNVITLDRPGFWRIVLRGLVFACSIFVVPVVGAIVMLASVLWDPHRRGRGWLDLVGGNWLVDSRDGLNPYDVKALRHARRRLEKRDTADIDLPSLATGADAAGERSALFAPGSRSHSAIVGGPQVASTRDTGAARAAEATGASPDTPVSQQPPAPPTSVATSPAPMPVPIAMPMPPVLPAAHSSSPTRPGSNDVVDTADVSGVVIVFDDGASYEVIRGGLIGRNPRSQTVESAETAESAEELLAVADDTMSISKTHAAFGIDARGFWISDRGSRNGTAIRSIEGASTIVSNGDTVYLQPGDTVCIGRRSFVVLQT